MKKEGTDSDGDIDTPDGPNDDDGDELSQGAKYKGSLHPSRALAKGHGASSKHEGKMMTPNEMSATCQMHRAYCCAGGK